MSFNVVHITMEDLEKSEKSYLDLDYLYDYLLEDGLVDTRKDLNIIIDICGWNYQTFSDILYSYTGYRTFSSYLSDKFDVLCELLLDRYVLEY